MHNVIGTRISSSKFTWVPKSKEFVTDASELDDILFNQICSDKGFVLISEKTGKEVPFTLAGTWRSTRPPAEVMFWEFTAVTSDPKLTGVTVVIHND